MILSALQPYKLCVPITSIITSMKSLCIYAYYEKNEEYQTNLRYFLKHGVNDASDFVFVLNGNCSVVIPNSQNIRIIRRENEGYDFGAYTAALQHTPTMEYDYIFFMNTSVRGPYLRDNSKHWQDVFIDMFKNDVKLVGTTINILPGNFPSLTEQGFRSPYSHVQSQMFAMDNECLKFLTPLIFADDATSMSFQEVIEKKEVSMSQYVLQNGWNINCVLPKYRDIDYRSLDRDINSTSSSGDPSFDGSYFGGTYTPYDVVFIKTNRGLIDAKELRELREVRDIEHFGEPRMLTRMLTRIAPIVALAFALAAIGLGIYLIIRFRRRFGVTL